MKRKTKGYLSLVLFASMFTFGCGGDDTTAPKLTGDARTAQVMINDFLVPTIEAFNVGRFLAQFPTPAALTGVDACESLDVCEDGTAEICTDQTGIHLDFTDCVVGGNILDGTAGIQGDSNSGTGILDITLNDNPVTGQFGYYLSQNGACLTQTFITTQVTANGYTALVTGEIVYCNPPTTIGGVPVPDSGNLVFALYGQERAIEFWFYEDSQPGAWSLNVWDTLFSEQYLFCTGHLYDDFECGPPPEVQ